MFGEKINAYKLVRKDRAQLASGENEQRNHMLNERVPTWMGRISAKKNSTQKCNLERPEKVIPVAVVLRQRVLATLIGETADQEQLLKVEKRFPLATCEKTQIHPEGVKGLSGPQETCGRRSFNQPFQQTSLGYSNS